MWTPKRAEMFRINLIPVQELKKELLLSEFYNIPRVFDLIRRQVAAGRRPTDCHIPERYSLDKGHLRFFYDKGQWVMNRYDEVKQEMFRRGLIISSAPNKMISDLPPEWLGDWFPNDDDIRVSLSLVAEKVGRVNEYQAFKREVHELISSGKI